MWSSHHRQYRITWMPSLAYPPSSPSMWRRVHIWTPWNRSRRCHHRRRRGRRNSRTTKGRRTGRTVYISFETPLLWVALTGSLSGNLANIFFWSAGFSFRPLPLSPLSLAKPHSGHRGKGEGGKGATAIAHLYTIVVVPFYRNVWLSVALLARQSRVWTVYINAMRCDAMRCAGQGSANAGKRFWLDRCKSNFNTEASKDITHRLPILADIYICQWVIYLYLHSSLRMMPAPPRIADGDCSVITTV